MTCESFKPTETIVHQVTICGHNKTLILKSQQFKQYYSTQIVFNMISLINSLLMIVVIHPYPWLNWKWSVLTISN